MGHDSIFEFAGVSGLLCEASMLILHPFEFGVPQGRWTLRVRSPGSKDAIWELSALDSRFGCDRRARRMGCAWVVKEWDIAQWTCVGRAGMTQPCSWQGWGQKYPEEMCSLFVKGGARTVRSWGVVRELRNVSAYLANVQKSMSLAGKRIRHRGDENIAFAPTVCREEARTRKTTVLLLPCSCCVFIARDNGNDVV